MKSQAAVRASAGLADDLPVAGRALARADLFYCLASAFLPPAQGLATSDWCEALAADVAELAPTLGLDARAALQSLRATALGPLARTPWLVEYSRLFLVPPVSVTLNTGVYLEGGLGGTAAQMMRQCYAAAGFAPREGFHDLPDHVAQQLEFVGALFERAAGGDEAASDQAAEFIEAFVDHWAAPLQAACANAAARQPSARPAGLVYGVLAGLLVDALDGHRPALGA